MSVQEEIIRKLADSLRPSRLEVVNESDRHKGHAGHDGGGESHFRLLVVSDAFQGKGRLERQRMVFTALGDLMGKIHALSMQAQTLDEENTI